MVRGRLVLYWRSSEVAPRLSPHLRGSIDLPRFANFGEVKLFPDPAAPAGPHKPLRRKKDPRPEGWGSSSRFGARFPEKPHGTSEVFSLSQASRR